jgi:hypothetical protein
VRHEKYPPSEKTREGAMSNTDGRNESKRDRLGEESGIIVFGGGGGRGCLGGGCLFWIVLSVALTVLVNLLLVLFSGWGSGVGV